MAHHTAKSAYSLLTERLNRFPQGAPDSPLLHKNPAPAAAAAGNARKPVPWKPWAWFRLMIRIGRKNKRPG